MAKVKKKKTPKNSSKKRKKTSGNREDIIIFGIFLIFIAAAIFVFYFIQTNNFNQKTVAVVNGEEITDQELDFWYRLSVLPEYRDIVTKQDFLMTSLIPQVVLIQEANKEGIEVSKEEIEKRIGFLVIESGLTSDEFEEHLNKQDIGINDITKSIENLVMINKLFEEKNIVVGNYGESFNPDEEEVQEYIDILMNNAEIELLLDNLDKLDLNSFKETGDELCGGVKPVVRLYTTSSCKVCKESGIVFQDLIVSFIGDGTVQAGHWSLDTGDNLLSLKEETGVPEKEVALFKKYSPDNKVPLLVVGCKYKLIGSFGEKEVQEFETIMRILTGE